MWCFDVGANQGFYTILFSKLVGSTGKVFAFEPVMGEFKKLLRNVWLNRCAYNVVLETMALGSSEGVTDMVVCLDGYGSRSSLKPPPDEVRARVTVQQVAVTTLDGYVRSRHINRIDFIKIDTEGAEWDILRGGSRSLEDFRPILILEMADVVTRQFGYRASQLRECLQEQGFTMFSVNVDGTLKGAEVKDTYRENLIAVPKEKLYIVRNLVRGS